VAALKAASYGTGPVLHTLVAETLKVGRYDSLCFDYCGEIK